VAKEGVGCRFKPLFVLVHLEGTSAVTRQTRSDGRNLWASILQPPPSQFTITWTGAAVEASGSRAIRKRGPSALTAYRLSVPTKMRASNRALGVPCEKLSAEACTGTAIILRSAAM